MEEVAIAKNNNQNNNQKMSLYEFHNTVPSFNRAKANTREQWNVPSSTVRELSKKEQTKNGQKEQAEEELSDKEKNKQRKKAATQKRLEEQRKQTSWNVVGKKVTKTSIRRPDPEDPSDTVTLDEDTPIPNRIIVLKNLPREGVSEKDLKSFFKKVGPVNHVNVLRNEDSTCKGIAFVEFDNVNDAAKSLLRLNKFWYEDRRVYLSYAKPRK